ncbi:SDR family oxidoreductase [Variovorax paradoxus]|nr:SDR family oxidoreductase [Variovorax paradoxus]MBT2304846.1 SDR family oxidoreductase [Variovorax paradoxus]
MDLNLKGKITLITGGTAGIGLATAERFALEGASLILCGRRAEKLEEAKQRIHSLVPSTKILLVQADVTSTPNVEKMVLQADREFGRIDVLVNNAGTGIYKPFLEVTEEEVMHAMQMNFFAMFRVTQRVVPLMIRGGGGSIVNVTGTSGSSVFDAPFFSTCSGPAKAAENRFTKALSVELGPSNIRVNSVAPGRTNTPERLQLWSQEMGTGQEEAAATERHGWGKRICLPGHRWGEADEIAALVAFVASGACGFMTGSHLVADGGETRD